MSRELLSTRDYAAADSVLDDIVTLSQRRGTKRAPTGPNSGRRSHLATMGYENLSRCEEAVRVSDESRSIIERFWQVMNTNDFSAVGRLLHGDFLLEWPQSGERIRGAENFVAMNEQYPAAGPWRFTVNRVVADGPAGVSDVTVTDGERVDRAVTFFQVRDGRIWRITEYWPEPFAPVEGRRHLVETS